MKASIATIMQGFFQQRFRSRRFFLIFIGLRFTEPKFGTFLVSTFLLKVFVERNTWFFNLENYRKPLMHENVLLGRLFFNV